MLSPNLSRNNENWDLLSASGGFLVLPVHVVSSPLFGPVNSFDQCDEPGAAKRYLEGNLLSRMFMLFPAVHNWLKVSQFSILASVPKNVSKHRGCPWKEMPMISLFPNRSAFLLSTGGFLHTAGPRSFEWLARRHQYWQTIEVQPCDLQRKTARILYWKLWGLKSIRTIRDISGRLKNDASGHLFFAFGSRTILSDEDIAEHFCLCWMLDSWKRLTVAGNKAQQRSM